MTTHDSAAERSVLSALLQEPTLLQKVEPTLKPEMFYETQHRLLYEAMLGLWSTGMEVEPVSLSRTLTQRGTLDQVGGLAGVNEVWLYANTTVHVERHADIVAEWHALREIVRIGNGMVKAVEAGHRPGKVVDRALSSLTSLVVHENRKELRTKKEFIAAELASMNQTETRGVTLPYEKLSRFTGDLIPGDVVGIPGYSNSGKTLFVSNLVRHYGIQRVPTIIFPTESQRKFLSRVAAAHARIPQSIAERDAWHLASDEQREAYEFALRDIETFPWVLIPQRNISPDEVIAHASARRREFDGETVVVVVDHMHRMNYGGKPAAFEVGDGTVRMRNWAGEDRHGGMILNLLYQPRKPPVAVNIYKPVTGYEIAGGGNVMAELDLILSPYRRWVKVEEDWQDNPYHRTPWGTPKGKIKDGHPEWAKPEASGAKLDDERVYVKIAKRRTGGEGPTTVLQIDAPSGYIYQLHGEDDRGTGTEG